MIFLRFISVACELLETPLEFLLLATTYGLNKTMNTSRKQLLNSIDTMFEQEPVVQALVDPLYKNFGIVNCSYMLLYENGESWVLSNKAKLQSALCAHRAVHQ